jgi:hypothetical protein
MNDHLKKPDLLADLKEHPKYIDEKEVSEITKRALPTLRNDRHLRRGIPYCKIGKSVRYALSDVIEYMECRRIVPENN